MLVGIELYAGMTTLLKKTLQGLNPKWMKMMHNFEEAHLPFEVRVWRHMVNFCSHGHGAEILKPDKLSSARNGSDGL